MDLKAVLQDYVDYLAPKLDVYEQAIYLYVLRHSRLLGQEQTTIGFKSARRKIGLGIGTDGTPMSEHTCYQKLRSLESKGCVKLLGAVHGGSKLRLHLPSEVPGLIPAQVAVREIGIDELDFYSVPELRLAILKREGGKCFYCLRTLDSSTFVIDHVVSRPEGGNGYWNCVAACRDCNNRKGDSSAENYLRTRYRGGFLDVTDFEERLARLSRLTRKELKPALDHDEA